MKLFFRRNDLFFKRPAGTSRGILTSKPTWFVTLHYLGLKGLGEVSLIPGLSIDDELAIDDQLALLQLRFASGDVDKGLARLVADHGHTLDFSLVGYRNLLTEIASFLEVLQVSADGRFPAIRFALEMALLDLVAGGKETWFVSAFVAGTQKIPVNGLIWMGEAAFMQEQIEAKLEEGYRCLKLKIGAIDFSTECRLLENIRNHFTPQELELRVDANGAFRPEQALDKLNTLSQFGLHSIEQPIKQGQWDEMASLCRTSPLPIALDEELIGVIGDEREALLVAINPQYIILKPSLLGGFHYAGEWIEYAQNAGIGAWVTSALESNIGLNAIAQWTALYNFHLPQGLGTGKLFTNNVPSNLLVEEGFLRLSS